MRKLFFFFATLPGLLRYLVCQSTRLFWDMLRVRINSLCLHIILKDFEVLLYYRRLFLQPFAPGYLGQIGRVIAQAVAGCLGELFSCHFLLELAV